MHQAIHYTNCPVCGSGDIKNVVSAKDFTATGESFPIAECAACSLRFTQNVPDAASISPYYKSENYISHTNTSKGLINRLYQWVRKKTLRKKSRLIIRTTGIHKGQLLDIGSGTGGFVNEMKQQGWQVTGLEPDKDARQLAKHLYKVELLDMDQLFQARKDSYDAITLWHVLEHVHELQAYVQQIKSLLKKEGKLFIAVPNYTSKDAAIYQEFWAAYDVPRHLYHFSPRSMAVLMEKNGLKLLQHLPMWYDSFYISLLSSKYKKGKTLFFTAALNGMRSNLIALGDVQRCSSVIYIIGK